MLLLLLLLPVGADAEIAVTTRSRVTTLPMGCSGNLRDYGTPAVDQWVAAADSLADGMRAAR